MTVDGPLMRTVRRLGARKIVECPDCGKRTTTSAVTFARCTVCGGDSP